MFSPATSPFFIPMSTISWLCCFSLCAARYAYLDGFVDAPMMIVFFIYCVLLLLSGAAKPKLIPKITGK